MRAAEPLRAAAGAFVREFWWFGLKQAWACLFGGLMLALILATHYVYPEDAALTRYDFLFLSALAIQALLLTLKLETWEEARVIFLFHVVGTAMELFKTYAGSWIYPEEAFFRIAGVPLFSGFMYSAVGSYLARVWRIFDFRFTGYPPVWATSGLAVAAYVNFFSHHYIFDFRYVLIAGTLLLYGPTMVYYRPKRMRLAMPLPIGFGLVALFIWFAENIGTFAGAWMYPEQVNGWAVVSASKLGSWYLLMILSFVMVTWVQRPRAESVPLTSARVAQG
ncbi:DUF817 domain-containing protein [Oceanibium sediminis]|uniref:DUF817 domain-containing protein n=1 Tax=Oceanibium sediminis TaxID=2026339 RepID=UPI000DD3293E|nr:DUF817 domain-containing protein [Oceanibium sediminis]